MSRKRLPSGIKDESIKIDKIRSVLIDKYGASFLIGTGQPYIFQRWVYCHCIYCFTNLNQSDIGRLLGVHRSYVIHSKRDLTEICKMDDDLRNQVIEIESCVEDALAKINVIDAVG